MSVGLRRESILPRDNHGISEASSVKTVLSPWTGGHMRLQNAFFEHGEMQYETEV